MKDCYDVIVVGGGPGGSWAAKAAAENGASVLILEKDREIGVPVRCAEGVSEEGLLLVVDEIDDKWISGVIQGARFVSPDGTEVDAYPDERGYILHRKLFDYDLAALAVKAGAELRTGAFVFELIRENNFVKGVKVEFEGEKKEIRAQVVIAADGTESRVGRWAGIETALAPSEMESCLQMTLTGIDVDPERVEFHLGNSVAPGGYAWVFPKSSRIANVGLGITGNRLGEKRPGDYLQAFINRRFPGSSPLTIVAGGVPVSPPLKQITGNGIMLVGDAARQTNPLSGGGIVNAMLAGRLAGKAAALAVKAGDVRESCFAGYVKEWNKAEGRVCRLSHRIKQTVDSFSDEDLNRTAKILLDIPPEKRNAFQVFKAALFKHPKLILEAAKIFI